MSLVGSWLYSTIGERFYDVINFLSIIQEIQFTLNNLGNNHSLLMLYYERKTLQKLQPQNYFQAIFRLQGIKKLNCLSELVIITTEHIHRIAIEFCV